MTLWRVPIRVYQRSELACEDGQLVAEERLIVHASDYYQAMRIARAVWWSAQDFDACDGGPLAPYVGCPVELGEPEQLWFRRRPVADMVVLPWYDDDWCLEEVA
jgi:hypothetical protein